MMDKVNDRIRKLVDNSENVQGFVVNHAVGGGTGSGLGICLFMFLLKLFYTWQLLLHFDVGQKWILFGRIWYFRDVTLQRRAQEEIERAKAKAEEAARHKAEFLATFSHEVRTPMNAIVGLSRLLANSELNEKQSE